MNSSQAIWQDWLLSSSGAHEVKSVQLIQGLWGGMGQLLRVELLGSVHTSVILKQIEFPSTRFPSLSETRKRHSYKVEGRWYESFAQLLPDESRVAAHLAQQADNQGMLLLLEDLQGSGYRRKTPPTPSQIASGLKWLAVFHSRFLETSPEGLWGQGCYWHLETRPDEYRHMPHGKLRDAAKAFDDSLRSARYQTLVHGDAKPANFLWDSGDRAAAVDFQYVGRGVGVRDVAYFLDCCLGEERAALDLEGWLTHYFRELRAALTHSEQEADADSLEKEWRKLFPVAWSDFNRFYQGWCSPGPLGRFSRIQLEQAYSVCGLGAAGAS